MTMTLLRAPALALLLLAACGPIDASDEVLVTFVDPETGFETTEVHDVEREIVHFSESGRMVLPDVGLAFPGWPTSGNRLGRFGDFQVRFGTEAGETRAFFTEAVPATICDIELDETGADVQVFATEELVPAER